MSGYFSGDDAEEIIGLESSRLSEITVGCECRGGQLDCLRQLVVVLCERSQLQDLVEFPYINLHDEVVGIIESRARAVDLMTHNYYELLYAFHVQRHNFRK
ncbi:hypothetical protein chiPu_0027392, partial [Chiloscyllium punctatum]|nr:hypothetical protein [Chiloscyllium punctatum]